MRAARIVSSASAGPEPRSVHLQRLLDASDSDSGLERAFLHHLEKRNLRLPTSAQRKPRELPVRPDFLYETSGLTVAIYIDGSYHDHPDRQARDREKESLLESHGYTVIRFGYRDDWDAIIDQHGWVFGSTS